MPFDTTPTPSAVLLQSSPAATTCTESSSLRPTPSSTSDVTSPTVTSEGATSSTPNTLTADSIIENAPLPNDTHMRTSSAALVNTALTRWFSTGIVRNASSHVDFVKLTCAALVAASASLSNVNTVSTLRNATVGVTDATEGVATASSTPVSSSSPFTSAIVSGDTIASVAVNTALYLALFVAANTAIASSAASATVVQCAAASQTRSEPSLRSMSLSTVSTVSTPVNTFAGVTDSVCTDRTNSSWLRISPLNR